MADTKIEWCDKVWNPWWGCNEIAPECGTHAPNGSHGLCYAAVFASRGLHATHAGTAVGGKWTGKITRSGPAVWAAPLKWGPQFVFTCSMSDFWHEGVPLPWVDEALDVMDRTPDLTYQILTKRPGNVNRRLADLKRHLPRNAWIGASVGHAQSLPLLKPLRQIEATLRFLSCEPLLTALPELSLDGIGWVIAGGQSGRDAVPSHPDWLRSLRDQCQAAGVPYFFKQWGEWAPVIVDGYEKSEGLGPFGAVWEDGRFVIFKRGERHGHVFRVGKKAAGAQLDGREWREMPT